MLHQRPSANIIHAFPQPSICVLEDRVYMARWSPACGCCYPTVTGSLAFSREAVGLTTAAKLHLRRLYGRTMSGST